MNLLKAGSAWLEKTRRKNASSLVTYQFAAGNSTVVKASVGRSIYQTDAGEGFAVDNATRDYLITAADLVINGAVAIPARGDQVIETDANGTRNAFQVMAPSGEPPWRWSDDYRQTYRVHTKSVGVL